MDISPQASLADALEYEISMMIGEVIAAKYRKDAGLKKFCKEQLKEIRLKLRKHKRKYGLK